VIGGNPLAVLLQSISGVSAIYPLVAFYDIHGRERERCYSFIVFWTPHEIYVHIIINNNIIHRKYPNLKHTDMFICVCTVQGSNPRPLGELVSICTKSVVKCLSNAQTSSNVIQWDLISSVLYALRYHLYVYNDEPVKETRHYHNIYPILIGVIKKFKQKTHLWTFIFFIQKQVNSENQLWMHIACG
jgi:hypothetical protein